MHDFVEHVFPCQGIELIVFLCVMVASPATISITISIEVVVIDPKIDLCEALRGFELRICAEISMSFPCPFASQNYVPARLWILRIVVGLVNILIAFDCGKVVLCICLYNI
jgi:hypothetical protein